MTGAKKKNTPATISYSIDLLPFRKPHVCFFPFCVGLSELIPIRLAPRAFLPARLGWLGFGPMRVQALRLGARQSNDRRIESIIKKCDSRF
jgi:hypothetical protein